MPVYNKRGILLLPKVIVLNPKDGKDAGMKVGYYDSNYFAKVFKRVTGMIPSEYRETD